MKKILIAMTLVGIVTIIMGCEIPGYKTQVAPTSTQFPVLPLDTQGKVILNSPLRAGPGITFDEIGQLPQGKNIRIIGTSPDIKWYLIAYSDTQGVSIQAWIPVESVSLDIQSADQPAEATTVKIPIETLTPSLTLAAIFTPIPTRTATATLIPMPTATYTYTFMPMPSITYTLTLTPATFPPQQPNSTENANILMVYDDISATLINISQSPISVTGVEFRRIDNQGIGTASFNSDRWLGFTDKAGALPPKDCVMINTRKSSRPSNCFSAWGFITTSQTQFHFWIETPDSKQFQVWKNNTLLQTCEISAGSCQFYVPQP